MKLKLLLASLAFMTFQVTLANGTKVGDLYYLLGDEMASDGFYSATVTYTGKYAQSDNTYSGNITIPESFTYGGRNYRITSIGDYAFYGCKSLVSVDIPSSVTSIGSYAFRGCTGLKKVIVSDIAAWCKISFGSYDSNPLDYAHHLYSDENTEITDLVIPDGVTSIRHNAFRSCNGLTSVTIPNSVTSIGSYAFYDCTGLTNVSIPSSVTSIGFNAFSGCTGLKKVIVSDIAAWCKILFENYNSNPLTYANHLYSDENTEIKNLVIPDGVTSIGSYAFYGCIGLTSATIPNSVTSIGSNAFRSCNGLTSVTIPNSVTSIGTNAFGGCSNMKSVTINSNAIISHGYYYSNDYTPYLKDVFGSQVEIFTIGNDVTSIGYLAFYGYEKLKVYIGDNISSVSSSAFNSGHSLFVNKGTCSLLALWQADYTPYELGTSSKIDKPSASAVTTQTTATITVKNIYPEYVYSYTIGYGNPNYTLEGNTITITGKTPKHSFVLYLDIAKNDVHYKQSYNFETRDISPRLVSISKNASAIMVKGSYNDGDAKVVRQLVEINGQTVEGNVISVNGLKPDWPYDATYSVFVQSGDSEYPYSVKERITTDALNLQTQQAKVISVGNVIVSAESNLDDAESNVGFEWRRTDWTEEFASNTGDAYLFEGTMEGYIRNLYTEKLWKYRPYYEANDGSRYYGEWVGIDPTNTSYFEPTVHTYAETNMNGNAATVKGYVQRGTDNVSVQGFKYWKSTASLSADRHAPAIPADAQTVEAEGRVMEITLTGLDYESDYSYVAFMKTTEGETFYGEVRTFSTGADPTGIQPILQATGVKPAVFNVYTLSGTMLRHQVTSLEGLPRGIYIVNHKKVMVK